MTRLVDLVRAEDVLQDLEVGDEFVLVLRIHLHSLHGYIALKRNAEDITPRSALKHTSDYSTRYAYRRQSP